MTKFIRSRLRSFVYAFSGWWYVLRTQQNTWIHAVFSIAVIIAGFVLRLSHYDWVLIVIAITLVWVAEFINTALEAFIDLVVEDEHPLAKVGKDVGAAAVLITALTAVIIGLLILGPPLWQRVSVLFATP